MKMMTTIGSLLLLPYLSSVGGISVDEELPRAFAGAPSEGQVVPPIVDAVREEDLFVVTPEVDLTREK